MDIFCELDPRGRPTNLDGEGSVGYNNDVEFGAEDGECWGIPDEEDSIFKESICLISSQCRKR